MKYFSVFILLAALCLSHGKTGIIIFIMPFVESQKGAEIPDRVIMSNNVMDEQGDDISDYLATFFAQSGYVKVVERVHIKRVMEEIDFSQTDILARETTAKAGKLVGANHLLVGTYSTDGKWLKLNARIIEVETGIVKGAAVAKGKNHTEVMQTASRRLLKVMGVESEYNQAYKVKRYTGYGSILGTLVLGGAAFWSHMQYVDADEKYTTSYNLTPTEYSGLKDKAQLHMNMRWYLGGGSLAVLGTGLYLLMTNKSEWIFTSKRQKVAWYPVITPGGVGLAFCIPIK